MDIIKPSFTIFEKPNSSNVLDVMKYIERIGRICYKSEAKITDDSCKRFINNLRENKHWAMLEHYIFVFEIPEWMALELINKDVEQRTDVFADYVEKLNYIRVNKTDKEDFENIPDPDYILSASATALNYLWETYPVKMNKNNPIARICRFMYDWFQPLMKVPSDLKYEPWGDTEGIRLLSNEEIRNLTPENRMLHDWVSVEFITDRGCCYSADTKVLTADGWKYFNETNEDDLFYSLDDDNNIVYVKANSFIRKKYNGKLHHWRSTQIDLLVTPNHNMWVFDYDKRSENSRIWKFIKSEDMKNSRYEFNKSANRIKKSVDEDIVLNGTIRTWGLKRIEHYKPLSLNSNLFYELLGYWITDGSISYGHDKRRHAMHISQIKETHRNRIRFLLKTLGINFYETKKGFNIKCPQFFDYVEFNFIKNKEDVKKSYYIKFKREFINKLSAENIDSLLKGIIGGNGTPHTKGKGYQIYTASHDFAEDLVELCLLSGRAANIYKVPPRYRKFPGKEEYILCKEQYVVSIISKNIILWDKHRSFKSSYFEEVDYNDYVYCVELPKFHRLYVMRDGKACWSGNSHEMVRHRPFSFAQESTRYCSYKGGLNVISPSYFEPEERSELYLEWNRAMRDAEAHYNKLLQLGAKPQEARAVLPNSTKTEIVVTGRFNEWIHFFKMRADKAAHPQMQELAYPLKEEFIKRWPEIFADDEE